MKYEIEKVSLEEFEEIMEKFRYEFNDEIIFRDTGGIVMVHVPSTGDMCELNEVSGEILKYLKENLQLKKIIEEKILKNYDVKLKDIYLDVLYIIQRFLDVKIIIEVGETLEDNRS